MEGEVKKVTRVEELDNFPFNSFQEFRRAIHERSVQTVTNRSVALEWLQ